MQARASDLDTEIDLRDLIRPLLRHKWWIVGATAALAIAAFVVSEFMMEKQYSARAAVVFTPPVWNAVLDPRIVNSTTQVIDAKSVIDSVMTDDLLNKIYQSPDLASEKEDGVSFGQFKQNFSATLSGTSQLLLQVSDADPQRAAQAANLWANNAAARLNKLYGASDATLESLGQQLEDAKKQWGDSEKALLDYLPKGQTDVLSAQLSQMQIAYNARLGKLHTVDLMLSDGRALDGRWAAMDAGQPLNTGEALSLLTLQQRANEVLLCNQQAAPAMAATTPGGSDAAAASDPSVDCAVSNGLSGLQLQVSAADLSGGNATVGEGRQALKSFMDGLQSQQKALQGELGGMEGQLATLRTDLETAQFQVAQLTQQRDLAQNTYQVLASQYANTRIEMAANAQVARVAGTAVPSNKVSSPRVLLNTALAAALGFVVSVGWILLVAWFQAESKIEEKRA